MNKFRASVLLPFLLPLVALCASPELPGHFAYQGGKEITEGHMRLTPLGGNKQRIDIWIAAQKTQNK